MSNVAHYFIAQHIPDLFRQEPRNVGVFVVKGGDAACKFLGQTEAGVLDKRKLKGLQGRDVYCQWVDYWKRVLGERAEGWQSQLLSVGRHYRVIDAGEVSDTGRDRASAVAEYLYSLLVSDGGLAEALGAPEEPDAVTVTLADEVTEQLDAAAQYSMEVLQNRSDEVVNCWRNASETSSSAIDWRSRGSEARLEYE